MKNYVITKSVEEGGDGCPIYAPFLLTNDMEKWHKLSYGIYEADANGNLTKIKDPEEDGKNDENFLVVIQYLEDTEEDFTNNSDIKIIERIKVKTLEEKKLLTSQEFIQLVKKYNLNYKKCVKAWKWETYLSFYDKNGNEIFVTEQINDRIFRTY